MRNQSQLFFSFLSAAILFASAAQAQVAVQDFEGPLPGEQAYPGGYDYSGGGANAEPTVFLTQITDQVAFGGVQSFQIDIDATNHVDTWGWYGGFGGFVGFYGAGFGFAQGQDGRLNAGNYEFSYDIKVVGNTTATPVGGAFGLFDPDYETAYGIDLNNDADMLDGFDIWQSEFTVTPLVEGEWAHVVWKLNTGTAPTASAGIATPFFDDETTMYFQLFFNNGGFGIDAGNIINIDNLQLEFIPPTAIAGDFDGDGVVGGLDFLLWQRDTSVGILSDWQAAYNGGDLTASFATVPEPSSLLLILSAALFAGSRRR